MIPIIFKIFLGLFVKEGIAVLPKAGDTFYCFSASVTAPVNFSLAAKASSAELDELINLCLMADRNCEIKNENIPDNEGSISALVEFKNLSEQNRLRLQRQLTSLQQTSFQQIENQQKMQIEWRNQ